MTDFRQDTDADLEAPPVDAEFRPAAPLKDEGVQFEPEEAAPAATSAKQAIKENGQKLVGQATDKARSFADQGKAAGADKIDQLAQMLSDAASTVEEKLGGQYAQFARDAADRVSGLSSMVRNKDVDEFVEDIRGFVRASPAVAIGIAAAVGFAVARVVQSGLDADGSQRA